MPTPLRVAAGRSRENMGAFRHRIGAGGQESHNPCLVIGVLIPTDA